MNITKTGNVTSYGLVFSPVYDSCLIVLAVFIVAINIMVVFLFVRKDYLRTKTNSFLVSLAVSDLLTGLLSIPLYLVCPVDMAVCITSSALYRCIAASTIGHILVVTLERYVAVIYPMRYYRMVTKNRVCLVIGIVWVFSITYSVVGISWVDLSNHNLAGIEDKKKYEIPYAIIGLVICFSLPLVLMIVCFARMFIAIRRQVKNIRRQAELSADPRNRSIASDKRALVIFASMLGIFVLSWLTWYITLLLVAHGKGPIIPQKVGDVFNFLRFATSLINPLLYTFLKHDFRRAVISMCPFVEKVTNFFVAERESNVNIRATLASELNIKTNRQSASFNESLFGDEHSQNHMLQVVKEKRQPETIELIGNV